VERYVCFSALVFRKVLSVHSESLFASRNFDLFLIYDKKFDFDFLFYHERAPFAGSIVG
jgi:hypothetical protein